ncbi:MAG: hypothetical protein D6797_05300 [Bdellovibrio sp.]|nr:MAG: hypothetical protein D6797_05300 [Bdellovibrio sp.]
MQKMRPWFFLILQSALILYVGHLLGGSSGLMIGLVLALLLNTFYYLFSPLKLKPFSEATKLEGQDPWGLLEMAQNLSQKAHLPSTPPIYLLSSESPQAMVLGTHFRNASIVLTTALLQHFSKKELEAILAYQIVSIKTQAHLAFNFATLFALLILSASNFLDRVYCDVIGIKQKNSFWAHPFSTLLVPLIHFLLHLPLGKKIYYKLDQKSAQLIGSPRPLAQVYWKLETLRKTKPYKIFPAFAPLFIANPLTDQGWTRYFQLQPHAKSRIQRLIGSYPI